MKRIRIYVYLCCLLGITTPAFTQVQGDTIDFDQKKFVLTSDNMITNPGFEDGFTGWTDATSSAAPLSAAFFTNVATGGVDNSKYLVGTTNSGRDSQGSIGTGWSIEAGKTYYFSYYVKYQDVNSGAGTEEWSKVSLTNNKTSFEEPKILIDPSCCKRRWSVDAQYYLLYQCKPLVCLCDGSFSLVKQPFRL